MTCSCIVFDMGTQKFSSKMDAETLHELRSLAKRTRKPISAVLGEAVSEYLTRVKVRPIFRDAADHVLNEHDDLLKRLAK